MNKYDFCDSAGSVNNLEMLASFTSRTFGWMFAGLLASFAAAIAVLYTPSLFMLLYGAPFGVWGITIIELVLVAVLSLRVNKLKPGTATLIFFLYAILNGIMLSSVFLSYNITSISYAFLGAGGIFGAMALFGYFTKKDLSKLGSILMFALIGSVIYSLIALLLGITLSGLIYSLIMIAVFMGLTVFDVQKIRRYYYTFDGDDDMLHKSSIICALQLYLDFINIFLRMLNLLGRDNRRR